MNTKPAILPVATYEVKRGVPVKTISPIVKEAGKFSNHLSTLPTKRETQTTTRYRHKLTNQPLATAADKNNSRADRNRFSNQQCADTYRARSSSDLTSAGCNAAVSEAKGSALDNDVARLNVPLPLAVSDGISPPVQA